MHRHLIAGALACFGSSLFAQSTITNPLNQPQGVLNNVQNTLQSGTQNAQGQVNGGPGIGSNAAVQGNANLQNNFNGQPSQLNSNLSTQVQGQGTAGALQAGTVQQAYNQQGNAFQANGINGSQGFQRQGQPMQPWQTQSQGPNAIAGQNAGAMQNRPRTELGNALSGDNMQQMGQSQNAGPVYLLRFDASGREFICVNGRSIYFDNVNSVSAQGIAGNQSQYRAGYGSYDGNNADSSKSRSSNANQPIAPPTPGAIQNATGGTTSSNSVDAASSLKTSNGVDASSTTTQANQNVNETKPNLDAKPDVAKPADALNDRIAPKP